MRYLLTSYRGLIFLWGLALGIMAIISGSVIIFLSTVFQWQLLQTILIFITVMGILSVTGFFLSGKLVGGFERITHLASKVGSGEFSKANIADSDLQETRTAIIELNKLEQTVHFKVNEMRNFVANASHELRTPLTTIKLRVEALRTGAIKDAEISERFLEEIELEIDRLTCLVNDYLDLTQIESGSSSLPKVSVNFSQLTGEVCEAFKTRADRVGVNFQFSAEVEPFFVNGIEEQLRRVVYNLLDNAIKYTPREGNVSVVVDAKNDIVRLEVRDTGFGISASNIPHLFERFYRVDATRPRYGSSRGSGLGLQIARSIVDTHAGKIGVHSEAGRGSTFFVELPILLDKDI